MKYTTNYKIPVLKPNPQYIFNEKTTECNVYVLKNKKGTTHDRNTIES